MREMTEHDEQRAREMRERDARMRALAVSCAAYVMNQAGPELDRDCLHYARDCAELAATLVVSAIFMEDAELRALKEENERLREMTLETLRTTPPKLTFPTT